jgi:hypothetical protein
MKHVAVSALGMILCFGVVGARAQTETKAKDPALQAAIDTRQKAILARSSSDWNKHTADDFMLINTRGEIENREARLKLLTTTKGGGVQEESPCVN